MKPYRENDTRMAAFTVIVLIAQHSGSVFAADPVAPAPSGPNIQPTFADWLTARPIAQMLNVRATDPLQKPPFLGQPSGSLKALAAGIRAEQLDAPNRAKAAAYLGTVDCVTYPDAQKKLIATMQQDPSEMVRYEAVMALRNMLASGCCNMDTACQCESCCDRKRIARETEQHARKQERAIIREAKCHAKKAARKATKELEKSPRYDCCVGCCNEKVLQALADTAYGKDDQCCWKEPSERVRQAAAEGMCLCATGAAPDGYFAPIPTGADVPTPATDGKDDESPDGKDSKDSKDGRDGKKETTPKEDSEPKPKEAAIPPLPIGQLEPVLRQPASVPVAPRHEPVPEMLGTSDQPVIGALGGHCIVGLKSRQFIVARAEFASTFEDRTYYFSSADAKAAFDLNPAYYAPAYGGIDPVEWLQQHEMVQGQFLREHEGRFYLFTTKQNWELFKQAPNRYVLNQRTKSNSLAVR